MKAQPAGPFPPLHSTFVKSEEFLLHVNPESEKGEKSKRFAIESPATSNPKEKVYFSLWLFLNTSPGLKRERIVNKLHVIYKT